MAIELTETAAKEIKSIIEDQHGQEGGLDPQKVRLRVGVRGGGCSGFNYLMELTEQENESDEKFDSMGVTLVCDPKSYLYLEGAQIDFRDEVMGRGFVFKNPNANHTCGCGSSFSA